MLNRELNGSSAFLKSLRAGPERPCSLLICPLDGAAIGAHLLTGGIVHDEDIVVHAKSSAAPTSQGLIVGAIDALLEI